MITKQSITETLEKDFEPTSGHLPKETKQEMGGEFQTWGPYDHPSLHTTEEEGPPRRGRSIASYVETPREPQLAFGPDKVRLIAGVVANVDETNVRVKCHLAADPISISLPRELFDDALANFGTPISIEIITDQKYRRMAISYRDTGTIEPDPELEALAKWADE